MSGILRAGNPAPTAALLPRELLRRLPKAELHCHLDGSVRPQTLLDLAAERGLQMPRSDAVGLADYMRADDAHDLEEYLARFEVTLAVMQSERELERISYELVADAARDGVTYLEVRFAPQLNTREGLALQDVVDASLRGLARAEREHGTTARLVVCALRHHSLATAVEQAELAVAYRNRGVVGFDLAGGEAGNPATRYAEAFALAQRHDVRCTCHAGEGAGPESVREALFGCAVHRLGHATRLIEDRELTEYANEHRVPLEICLTSNVQTHAAPSLRLHPFREYYDRGLNVMLNTDNRLMSDTTLTDEYAHANAALGFTFDELAAVALNGFESAFVEEPVRRRLADAARAEIARLRTEGAA